MTNRLRLYFLGWLILLSTHLIASGQNEFPFDKYGGEKYCLKADFDGNGTQDYVAPIAEGWIKVFRNYGSKSEKTFDIDAGGVVELYEARDEAGEHGEPAVKNPSILVRWVGQDHVVFTWDKMGFKKIVFPGFYEKP